MLSPQELCNRTSFANKKPGVGARKPLCLNIETPEDALREFLTRGKSMDFSIAVVLTWSSPEVRNK